MCIIYFQALFKKQNKNKVFLRKNKVIKNFLKKRLMMNFTSQINLFGIK